MGAAGVPDLVHDALVHVALPRVEVQGDHLQVQGLQSFAPSFAGCNLPA